MLAGARLSPRSARFPADVAGPNRLVWLPFDRRAIPACPRCNGHQGVRVGTWPYRKDPVRVSRHSDYHRCLRPTSPFRYFPAGVTNRYSRRLRGACAAIRAFPFSGARFDAPRQSFSASAYPRLHHPPHRRLRRPGRRLRHRRPQPRASRLLSAGRASEPAFLSFSSLSTPVLVSPTSTSPAATNSSNSDVLWFVSICMFILPLN
jgi:hypothetical protein